VSGRQFQGPLGQFLSQRPETAPDPALPASNVSPDVAQVHTSLIKPGHTSHATFHLLRGDLQPHRRKRIAQEVEAPADPADEGLVGVWLV